MYGRCGEGVREMWVPAALLRVRARVRARVRPRARARARARVRVRVRARVRVRVSRLLVVGHQPKDRAARLDPSTLLAQYQSLRPRPLA